ncbi:hypothetical protein [Streptomyces sp. NPDC006309]|uniref:hypothetical protein n=1 Tax=Streptomyces sp. NPDC006309 TaxID=3156749 RepID=UPI0033A369F4
MKIATSALTPTSLPRAPVPDPHHRPLFHRRPGADAQPPADVAALTHRPLPAHHVHARVHHPGAQRHLVRHQHSAARTHLRARPHLKAGGPQVAARAGHRTVSEYEVVGDHDGPLTDLHALADTRLLHR